MVTAFRPIPAASFRELHPNQIEDPEEIRGLLERLARERVPLRRGTNRRVDAELAVVTGLDGDSMQIETTNFESDRRAQILLNAKLDGRPYFFSVPRLGELAEGVLRVGVPAVVHVAERRDRARQRREEDAGAPTRVVLRASGRHPIQGVVHDSSPDGLAILVPASAPLDATGYVPLRFLDGERAGRRAWARVRHVEPCAERHGWRRVGLAVTSAVPGGEVEVKRDDAMLHPLGSSALRHYSAMASASGRRAARSLLGGFARSRETRRSELMRNVRLAEYTNEKGERIRALIDFWGDPRGAPAVVIPPAWGKTKETLLALAATIVETFRRAGQPVLVLRFDGIRKRGESHTEPECRAPGAENLCFTFSQGVRDIQTTLDFLERTPEFAPSTSIVVSFSGSSIDARRAVALERRGRIGGWVCVVGSADLQAMMRVISGGVDYLGGVERGVQFGHQGVLGLTVDVDTSSRDALEEKMAFLEDARRDFGTIDAPVTWIHGRYDAWMDVERVRHAMSFGDVSRRRLIEVPTGHQLKTSREALSTFQLVAREVSRMALGRELKARLPDLVSLERRRNLERRRQKTPVDVKSFWTDYLVGREGCLGMELLTSTSAYRSFVSEQIRALDLRDGQRVVDLGSGTGTFPRQLGNGPEGRRRLEVIEVDYVRDALLRARQRLEQRPPPDGVSVRYLECNLDSEGGGAGIPLASGSADALFGALLVNYLSDPIRLLQEGHRILRPGGRLVLSSLKRDADISKICVEGVRELRGGLARDAFGDAGERLLDESIRRFMSDAARLLDLEELGIFRFWDPPELRRLIAAAGFRDIELRPAFGDPPQALIVTARRG